MRHLLVNKEQEQVEEHDKIEDDAESLYGSRPSGIEPRAHVLREAREGSVQERGLEEPTSKEVQQGGTPGSQGREAGRVSV